MHPVSASVSTAPFTQGKQGEVVKLKSFAGSVFCYPSEVSGEFQVRAGLTEVGKYQKDATKNNQMCTYTRDVIVYVHDLGTCKQVIGHFKRKNSAINKTRI